MWFKKSRLIWNIKGDRNTKLFHLIASSRQNRNLLNPLSIDGKLLEDPLMVKQEVFNYCQKIFQEEWKVRPTFF